MGWDVCFVLFFIYILLPGFQHKNYRQVLDLFNKRTKLLEGGGGADRNVLLQSQPGEGAVLLFSSMRPERPPVLLHVLKKVIETFQE